MSEERPRTLAALGEISGVGSRKQAAYGAAFLAVLTGEAPPPVSAAEQGKAGNAAVLGILKGKSVREMEGSSNGSPDADIVTRLKAWRLALAREYDKPAFTILTNRELDAVAARSPGSEAELQSIPGLGPKKIGAYGADILRVVAGG
jgi:ATP-dependent DNA helicase RecQ